MVRRRRTQRQRRRLRAMQCAVRAIPRLPTRRSERRAIAGGSAFGLATVLTAGAPFNFAAADDNANDITVSAQP